MSCPKRITSTNQSSQESDFAVLPEIPRLIGRLAAVIAVGFSFVWASPGLLFLVGHQESAEVASRSNSFQSLTSESVLFSPNPNLTLPMLLDDGQVVLDSLTLETRSVSLDDKQASSFLADGPPILAGHFAGGYQWSVFGLGGEAIEFRVVHRSSGRAWTATPSDKDVDWEGWPGQHMTGELPGEQRLVMSHRSATQSKVDFALLESSADLACWKQAWEVSGWNLRHEAGGIQLSNGFEYWTVLSTEPDHDDITQLQFVRVNLK